MQHSYQDEITGIENTDNYLVNSMSLWYGTDSKLGSEQALFYSMIHRDPQRFWPSLRKYIKLHQGESFPLHAQEAYIIFIDRAPEKKKMMMPVSEEIYDRYKLFWSYLDNLMKGGMKHEDIPAKMREEYGDTYWYYYMFTRKVYHSARQNNSVGS